MTEKTIKSKLKAFIKKGFTRAQLERLIKLPKNHLAGYLKGSRKLSRRSVIKIELYIDANPDANPFSND